MDELEICIDSYIHSILIKKKNGNDKKRHKIKIEFQSF